MQLSKKVGISHIGRSSENQSQGSAMLAFSSFSELSCSLVNSSKQASLKTQEPHRLTLGRQGEAYAAAFLQQNGYRIVAANFTVPVGRNLRGALVSAEIDLVAYDGPTLCFIEVKTRASDWFAPPQVNIDRRKQRQISRAAQVYRRMFGVEELPHRFDVVTVVLPDQATATGLEVELIRNFWTETNLRTAHREQAYYD